MRVFAVVLAVCLVGVFAVCIWHFILDFFLPWEFAFLLNRCRWNFENSNFPPLGLPIERWKLYRYVMSILLFEWSFFVLFCILFERPWKKFRFEIRTFFKTIYCSYFLDDEYDEETKIYSGYSDLKLGDGMYSKFLVEPKNLFFFFNNRQIKLTQ